MSEAGGRDLFVYIACYSSIIRLRQSIRIRSYFGKMKTEVSGESLLANLPVFCDGFTKSDNRDMMSVSQEPKFMAEWTQENDTGEKLQMHTNLLAFRVRKKPQRKVATKRLLDALHKNDHAGKRKTVDKKRKVETTNKNNERNGRNRNRRDIEQWTSSRLRNRNRRSARVESVNVNEEGDDNQDEDYEESRHVSSDDDDFM